MQLIGECGVVSNFLPEIHQNVIITLFSIENDLEFDGLVNLAMTYFLYNENYEYLKQLTVLVN